MTARKRRTLTDQCITRLRSEPWVELAQGDDLAGWGKEEEIRYNQANRQTEKYRFFRRVFDYLKENEIGGDYHEYGCHRARTFRMALTEARRHGLDGMRFWAFDSFAGLPDPVSETSVSKWTKGALTTSESEFLAMIAGHGIYVERVKTVPGFYAHSLDGERQRHFIEKENPIALVTVDCDLYESALPVFEFIEPLLQDGSVVYVDDLFVGNKGNPGRGVARAFLEWQRRSRWRFLRHLDVGWWGRSYIAVDGPALDGMI
ncbi:MAG TPA: TylF/MycF/NovP-related O-methyltransferase [Hyphomicrobiaceae bacterium]|nr:TylF/MycF/NovP-related O-methyltransferase [Hyphomicrobiaceae bacterium]